MELKAIIAELDAEITRLQQVKSLLSGQSSNDGHGAARGSRAGGKRVLSAAARAKIAAAQRRRWAKQRKTAK